jgi:hypothetical protein
LSPSIVTDTTGLSATNSFVFEANYLSALPLYLSGSNYFNGRWADYDNDGRLDLYAGGSIYHNNGGLSFTRVANLFSGDRNGVAWCDFNSDGKVDIAIAGGGTTGIYRNDGNGVFTLLGGGIQGGSTLQGVNNAAIAWGDYDNDGKPDLLVTGEKGGGLAFTGLYRNNGDGTFSLAQNTGLPQILWGAVAFGDFDNDGKLDILMNGLSGGGPVAWFTEVYHNNSDGTFTALGAGLFGVEEGSVSVGDIDNDGYLDLLTDGFNYGSYVLHVYHNNGNNTFT